MILVLSGDACPKDVLQLMTQLTNQGFRVFSQDSDRRRCIAVLGDKFSEEFGSSLQSKFSWIEACLPFRTPYKLASRLWKSEPTLVKARGASLGGKGYSVIAGPCAVESEEQIFRVAEEVSKQGGTFLRGGAFKPRTSPYSFRGLGEEGLRYLHEAGKAFGLVTVSETLDVASIDVVARYVDILQVGSRNMQNFALLRALGRMGKPVVLKRGFSATYEELLLAAEYILQEGNEEVILCERGIRSFENYTRNTLDITAIPVLKELSHLPVIVDPSHGTGYSRFVTPLAKAAIVAGADGVMVEVHPEPAKALSDAEQALDFAQFACLMSELAVLGPRKEVPEETQSYAQKDLVAQ